MPGIQWRQEGRVSKWDFCSRLFWEADFPRVTLFPIALYQEKFEVCKNSSPPSLFLRRSHVLSSQLRSSSSGPTTGFLRGPGLDGGPYPARFSLTNLLHRLGQAQTRLHHVWARERRVRGASSNLGYWTNSPRPHHSQDAKEVQGK